MVKTIFFFKKFGRILSWKKRWRGSSQRGVSMIELLVVMAIIAIMLGWGGVHMVTHLSEYRLKAAVRDLISTMQKARRIAIRENADAAVFFDPDNGTYSLCTDSGNNCTQERSFASYDRGIGYGHGTATRPVPDGATFPGDDISYTSKKVIFISRGNTYYWGYVYLQNNKGQTYAVGTRRLGTIVAKQWNGANWESY